MNPSDDFRDHSRPGAAGHSSAPVDRTAPSHVLRASASSQATEDDALIHALESHPAVIIPAGFAQQVMSRLPVSQTRSGAEPLDQARDGMRSDIRFAAPRIGPRIALVCACLLFSVLFLLAINMAQAEPAHPVSALAVCWTFALESIVLTLWLTLRPDGLS